MHLRALQPHLEALGPDGTPFEEISKVFPPLFRTIQLVWQHSKYYATADHMIVLLKEIVNELIDHALAHVQPEDLFNVRTAQSFLFVDVRIRV